MMIISVIGLLAYLMIETSIYGYLSYRVGKKISKKNHFRASLLVMMAILFTRDVLMHPMFNVLDLRISNSIFIGLLGTDRLTALARFDWMSPLYYLLQSCIGYFLGKKVSKIV
jgi:hypothetical protein